MTSFKDISNRGFGHKRLGWQLLIAHGYALLLHFDDRGGAVTLQEKCKSGHLSTGVLARSRLPQLSLRHFPPISFRRDFRPRGICSRQFPRFCVLPGDVCRMIEVQQQSFAPIEKSETKEIVVK